MYHILEFFQKKKIGFTMGNTTCCLCYTVNAMPADALATYGARATASMALTK